MHIYILLFSFLLPFTETHALDWYSLEKGMAIELHENLTLNKLRARAGMQCRVGMKAVYPKGSIGPKHGDDVIPARFFTVVEKYSDVVTYRIALQSEQLPCSCVVTIDQTPGYLKGQGFDFRMFSIASEAAMAKMPSIPSSCGNNPDWLDDYTGPMMIDSDSTTLRL